MTHYISTSQWSYKLLAQLQKKKSHRIFLQFSLLNSDHPASVCLGKKIQRKIRLTRTTVCPFTSSIWNTTPANSLVILVHSRATRALGDHITARHLYIWDFRWSVPLTNRHLSSGSVARASIIPATLQLPARFEETASWQRRRGQRSSRQRPVRRRERGAG